MEKGYYSKTPTMLLGDSGTVAIHNKNGKGLLQDNYVYLTQLSVEVAIHNKNGKGLLPWDLL